MDDEGKGGGVPDLIPARMLNEFVYCPRLCYLEWIQGEFEESVDTVEGRYVHRRVDEERGVVAERGDFQTRSVYLSSTELGISCRVDILEGDGGTVIPVDYKKGKGPGKKGAWECDRVQICAEGLVLRDQGFDVREGIIYYAGSKQKVISRR